MQEVIKLAKSKINKNIIFIHSLKIQIATPATLKRAQCVGEQNVKIDENKKIAGKHLN